MRRVLTPQLVAQACSSLFAASLNVTSNALAKFCPRKCDVPAWSALPSCAGTGPATWPVTPAMD